MATYRKLLKNRAGDTIIPVVDWLEDYSTSEVDTGRLWVDGKHIYKKSVSIGSMPNNTQVSKAHGISNFSQLIKAELRWKDTADNRWYYNARWDNTTTYVILDGVNATSVVISGKGTNWSTRTNNGYATIYYTKSS